MAGNSWLAIAQINYASRLRHPALKALAPWEIFTDVYRDFVFRGGMTQNSAFMNLLIKTFAGNSVANMPAMAQHRPLYDDYWNTKYIMTENISVPLYILASFSSMIHTRGSFQVCRTADTKQKWLRVHPYQEWYDLYRPEAVDDLQAFYDRFLKGAHNGWEQRTPPVRLSILGFEATGGESKTVIERPEQEFPLSRQTLKIFYLDAASKTLKTESTPTATWAEHPAHDLVASSDFKLHFDSYQELAGYAKVRLWVSSPNHNDMDVVVQIRKISRDGKLLEHLNYPCPIPADEVENTNVVKALGPQGFLRASHAVSYASELSTEQEIFYKHDCKQEIAPGDMASVPPNNIHSPEPIGADSEFFGIVSPAHWTKFLVIAGEKYETGPLYPWDDDRSFPVDRHGDVVKAGIDIVVVPGYVYPEPTPFTDRDIVPEDTRAYYLKADTAPRYFLNSQQCDTLIQTRNSNGVFAFSTISGVGPKSKYVKFTSAKNEDEQGVFNDKFLTLSKTHTLFRIQEGKFYFYIQQGDSVKVEKLTANERVFIPKGTPFRFTIQSAYAKTMVMSGGGKGIEELFIANGREGRPVETHRGKIYESVGELTDATALDIKFADVEASLVG